MAYVPIAASSDWKQYTGLGLVVAGLLIEVLSEEQRKVFKAKSENKGKLCDEGALCKSRETRMDLTARDFTGLFGLVRHPNYLGYTIWRTGLALSTVSGDAEKLLLQP